MNEGYIIRARIRVDDHTGSGAASAEQRLRGVEREGERVSGRLSSLFQGAFAFIGGAAGLGMVARGIIGLNAPIQEASYGMATLLSAQTGAGINDTLSVAKGLIGDLRADAAVGVGELANYTSGLQAILGPGLAAGASLQQLRELTKLSLAAGFALRGQEGLHLAPRDLMQAMTTGANQVETPIVNQALNTIGVTNTEFNKFDPAKKLETLNRAFQTFAPGVELMGKSWTAQMSTLQDQIKVVLGRVTSPLFERWSEQLQGVNRWLTRNSDSLGVIADRWGAKLVKLWDHLVRQAGTYAALAAAAGAAQALPGAMQAGRGAMSAVGGVFASGAGSGLGAALRDPLGIQKWIAAGMGTSTAGLTSGLLPGLSALGTAASRLVAPLALVTTAFLAVKGGIAEYPQILGFIAEQADALWISLQDLGAAFGGLTDPGSPLNLVGATLAGAFGGFLWAATQAVKVIASLVTGLGLMFGIIGDGLKSIYYLASGDLASAAKIDIMGRMNEANRRLSNIWFPTEADSKKPGADGGTLDPKALPKKQSVTNINGPVKFELKTEQNADPARVMSAFSEGVDRLSRFATQARRVPVPT